MFFSQPLQDLVAAPNLFPCSQGRPLPTRMFLPSSPSGARALGLEGKVAISSLNVGVPIGPSNVPHTVFWLAPEQIPDGQQWGKEDGCFTHPIHQPIFPSEDTVPAVPTLQEIAPGN